MLKVTKINFNIWSHELVKMKIVKDMIYQNWRISWKLLKIFTLIIQKKPRFEIPVIRKSKKKKN